MKFSFLVHDMTYYLYYTHNYSINVDYVCVGLYYVSGNFINEDGIGRFLYVAGWCSHSNNWKLKKIERPEFLFYILIFLSLSEDLQLH